MIINLNDQVKVRLTDRGHKALEADHFSRFSHLGFNRAMKLYMPPEEDLDGYSKWALWDLMRTFGPHIEFGGPLIMETTIKL